MVPPPGKRVRTRRTRLFRTEPVVVRSFFRIFQDGASVTYLPVDRVRVRVRVSEGSGSGSGSDSGSGSGSV